MLENAIMQDSDDTNNALAMILNEKVIFQQKSMNSISTPLFSVNLGLLHIF